MLEGYRVGSEACGLARRLFGSFSAICGSLFGFSEAGLDQVRNLICLLLMFEVVLGLKVNLSKSKLIGV